MEKTSFFDAIRQRLSARQSYSREVLESFGANLFIAGLNLASGLLLARLLGAEGRGELAAIQALPMIIGGVGQFGLHEAIIYFGSRDRARVGKYTISGTSLICVLGVPLVLASALATPWFLREQTSEVVFASRIYLILLFANAVHGIPIATSRALHRISFWNLLRLLSPTMWVLMVVSFTALEITDPTRLALTYISAYLLLATIMILAVRRYLRGYWRPRISLWPRMLRYGMPVAAAATPQFLGDRIDQLLIAGVLPPRELGVYAVAVAISAIGALPELAMTAVAFSKVAAIEKAAEQLRFVRRASWALAGVTAAAVVALALLTPLLIRWVLPGEFHESTPIVWILLGSVFIRSIARMLQVGMQAVGRPVAAMYSQWAGLLLLLPAMTLLIPRMGVTGAAWSLVLSSAASLATIFVLFRRCRES